MQLISLLINLFKITLLQIISIKIQLIKTINENSNPANKYSIPDPAYTFEEKIFCQMNGLTNESS